jgi:chemotaxis protein CheC
VNAHSALTASQADALTELINIAFGLTAAKLSEISGSRVVLDVPTIAIHPVRALVSELRPFVTGPAASVHQVFSGPISGDAILLLNYDGAVKLSNLLVEEHLRAQRLDSSTGEILTELGNMLLSACLGVFGNLLRVHVTFSIPQLHLDSLEHFLSSISIGGDELRYAVVITSSFNIFNQEVDGRLVIVLGVSSLERLIQAVEQWEGSQSSA